MEKIKKVAVVGGGLMGSGIAQVSAAAGFPTTVREISEPLCAKSRQSIEKTLAKGMERGKVTEAERDTTLRNLRFVTDLKELADSNLFIEAVVEDLDVKNRLWSELNQIARPDAIFASNTSSLTIIAMAAASGRSDRMLGLHFFNPVPLMKLVEVVRTITTSEDTERSALDFVRALGKEPIRAKDRSGFVGNLRDLLLCSTLSASIPFIRSRRSCSPSIGNHGMLLRPCSSEWCWRECSARSRGKGSMTTPLLHRE